MRTRTAVTLVLAGSIVLMWAAVSFGTTVILPTGGGGSGNGDMASTGTAAVGAIPIASDTSGDAFVFTGPTFDTATGTFALPTTVGVAGTIIFTEGTGASTLQYGLADATDLSLVKDCRANAVGAMPPSCVDFTGALVVGGKLTGAGVTSSVTSGSITYRAVAVNTTFDTGTLVCTAQGLTCVAGTVTSWTPTDGVATAAIARTCASTAPGTGDIIDVACQ